MKKLIRVLWAIEKDLRVIASNTKVSKVHINKSEIDKDSSVSIENGHIILTGKKIKY